MSTAACIFTRSHSAVAPPARFIVLCLFGFALVVPLVVFLVGEQIGDGVRKAAPPRSREGNSPETFTGRIPLWQFLISHSSMSVRFFGFGFQGFWTPEHTDVRLAGRLIQHAHFGGLNILLELGYVGLALFIGILIFGCTRSDSYLRRHPRPSLAVHDALLTWAIVALFFSTAIF